MYIVGFVDDDREAFVDYKDRLVRKNIELCYPDGCSEMGEIVDWIIEKNIKCVMVDYKLKRKFKFLGTDLVTYINSVLPDLPCIILTNYPEDSIGECLVVTSLIIDRSVLDADEIEDFVIKIKQSVEVFENRITLHNNEYLMLLDKKRKEDMSAREEERFQDLYKLLRAYGEIDDLPAELMNTEVNKKIDEILGKVDVLINTAEQR